MKHSLGVRDQTIGLLKQKQSRCPHEAMYSVRTGSTGVPYVEQCLEPDCLWIDPEALEKHVENAIKINATSRAQRIAVTAESEPFAFTQSSTEELSLEEILLQALAAAQLQGIQQGPVNASDGRRMTQIFRALKVEVERALELARLEAKVEVANQLRTEQMS